MTTHVVRKQMVLKPRLVLKPRSLGISTMIAGLINQYPGTLPARSNRARRLAKKCFTKRKQVPSGYTLLYKMNSVIDFPPMPTDRLKSEWAFLDKMSEQMFRKKFDNLKSFQKARLIESLHKEE